MVKGRKQLSRRRFVEMAIGANASAFLGASTPVFAQGAERLMSWPLPLGPFYPEIKPLEKDADLTQIARDGPSAAGQVIHLMGRVLDMKGEPIGNAKIELWQADSRGRYKHPSDPNPKEADPYFQGFGAQTTAVDGRFHFKTVKPAAYPGLLMGMRAPHIHFDVAGRYDRVVTQMFFPNEPENAADGAFKTLSPAYRKAMTAKLLPPTPDMEPGSLIAQWDIVLRTG